MERRGGSCLREGGVGFTERRDTGGGGVTRLYRERGTGWGHSVLY